MSRIAENGYPDIAALALEASRARRRGLGLCLFVVGRIRRRLIAERRAAGVYGPKRHRKQMLATAAGVAAGLAVIIFLIV